MAQIRRGEIYWADLDPTKGYEQAGQRPVLILSNDIFNQRSGTVIAMALTSQPPPAAFPLTMEVLGANLPKKSWIKISQIRTLSVERLSKIGRARLATSRPCDRRPQPNSRSISFASAF